METKREAGRCAIGAFSSPIGKFIGRPRHAFPISVFFLFTIRFSRRPSGSETVVPRRDLFEWFPSQSGPLVKFLLASTFFALFLPLLLPLLLLLLLSSFVVGFLSDRNPSNRSRFESGFTWPISSPLYLSKMPRSCTWGDRDRGDRPFSLGSLNPLSLGITFNLASHRNFRVAQFISYAYLISPTQTPILISIIPLRTINTEISMLLHLERNETKR